MTEVAVKRLPHGADLPLPASATADSAGLDLLAAIDAMESAFGSITIYIRDGIWLTPSKQLQLKELLIGM